MTKPYIQGESFKINLDTITINLKPYVNKGVSTSLTHSIKYNNKYYCYFNEDWGSTQHPDVKHFFIVSEKGIIEHSIKLPSPIQNCTYFDLFVLHDTIYTKAYMEDATYYLDLHEFRWKPAVDADDVIYEDEKFYVTYLDFGEWGATTWFKDKHTGKETELVSSSDIINRVDSIYYITYTASVLLLENPLKMKQCDTSHYYEKVKKDPQFHQGSNSLLGTKTIYKDTNYSYKNSSSTLNLSIETSFKVDNHLYYLCIDSAKTYIATLENQTLVPIQTIGQSFQTFNWYYAYRCRIQKDNSQLLQFNTKDKLLFGFIDLNGYSIGIRYLRLIE